MDMETIIDKIKKGSKIAIKSSIYNVNAKAKYVTEKNPEQWYVKIFLEDNFVLVICQSDDLIYFGKDIGSIEIHEPFGKQIVYNNEKYILVGHDYQIMTHLEFGSPITTEGEVEFWDYECPEDKNKIISIGIIKRTNKRSDMVGNILSLDDIRILKEG